jgi:microcin C transport system substrate-binding protein
MRIPKFIFAIGFILLFPFIAIAETSHGLSLYGPQGLKYKPGQPYDFSNPQAPKGGRLTLSTFGAFTKLNPASLKGVTAPGVGQFIFQTAMDSSIDDDEPFSQYGNLVETVELAEDRMSLVYHIYKNAKFSDGHPVTADDFVFSFQLLQDPEYHPFYKAYFKDIKSVEKIDEHSIKYIFSILNQELPLITGQMIIFPKHVYGQKGKSFGTDFDNIAIGSGPYMVDKYEFGKHIRLKRNPGWWGYEVAINKGRYNYDFISWKVFLDPVAMREGFKGGIIDAQAINSSRDWALEYKGEFIKKKYYLREELPHNRVAGMQGYAFNTRNELFKSRMVRAALAMVFDFNWSNNNLFYGQYTRNECYFDNNKEMKAKGLPMGGVKKLLQELRQKYKAHVPKTVFTKAVGAPGQGIPIEKNIQVANALLDRAGWQIGEDGIRKKNGKKFQFTMLLDSPLWQRISEPFQNNLKKIGVDMKIRTVQAAEMEEKQRNFKYDMIIVGFPQSRSPGNEQRSMWSSEAADTEGARNFMGIKNPAVDELIDQMVRAETRRELVDIIQAMDRILTHQFYLIPHWYIAYDRIVYWNRFSRPKINASQSAAMNNLMEWWWWDKTKADKLKKARAEGKVNN